MEVEERRQERQQIIKVHEDYFMRIVHAKAVCEPPEVCLNRYLCPLMGTGPWSIRPDHYVRPGMMGAYGMSLQEGEEVTQVTCIIVQGTAHTKHKMVLRHMLDLTKICVILFMLSCPRKNDVCISHYIYVCMWDIMCVCPKIFGVGTWPFDSASPFVSSF